VVFSSAQSHRLWAELPAIPADLLECMCHASTSIGLEVGTRIRGEATL
jgi:hypothetical protein